MREGCLQLVPIVMISCNQEHGHRQRLQDLAQHDIFLAGAVIDEVAGGDDCIGQARKSKYLVDTTLQHGAGVDSPVGQRASWHDVRITDLTKQHAAERSRSALSPLTVLFAHRDTLRA